LIGEDAVRTAAFLPKVAHQVKDLVPVEMSAYVIDLTQALFDSDWRRAGNDYRT